MNQEEKINCAQCGKDLIMHVLPINDIDFCSSWCLELYKREKGDRKFFLEFKKAMAEMGDRWVPKGADEYVRMCGACHKDTFEACHAIMDLSGSMINTLSETEEMHWCCHGHFNLSAALSDGTVSLETARKVQKQAEKLSKVYGHKGVTVLTLTIALADLAKNLDYEKRTGTSPEIDIPEMSHAAACLLCNPDFGKQCEIQVEEEFRLAEKVRPRVKNLWCQHCIQALAHLMMNRKEEDGFKLVDAAVVLAEKVAEERGHKGVVTADLFVALGRMAA